ncbi:MAG TPA: 50S ribosomal protein L21 [Candidatus Bacteroides intestinavium]|uniref:Large ribosomal subunit protein bL21 n=1 Tax=Candidatus Bacteroides intestinavium TaxID=2838469 RepID=A0A9D2KUZ1_9BACE|nr:50S ribosomal protein L21 [Candidatus Bacteroides intestinavium]
MAKENNVKYVIVEIQGQQFKAEAGKKLFVHHIQNIESGATVEFDKVLLVDKDGDITVGVPTVEGAKVVCEVLSPLVKGEKVLVFHKKRRKGYRKLKGHREQFTELTIKEVVA